MKNIEKRSFFENLFYEKLNVDKEKKEPDPRRDWFLVCALFVAGGIFSVFCYRTIFGLSDTFIDPALSTSATTTEISIDNLNNAKMRRVLLPWEEKEKKFGELYNNRPDFDFNK